MHLEGSKEASVSEHSLRGSTGEVQSVRVVGAGPMGGLFYSRGSGGWEHWGPVPVTGLY